MNFFEGVSSAFSNVYSHKLRSMLTMLGIIIGISSVIMITGVGEGVKNSVFSIVSAINRNFVQVYYRGGEPENYLRLTDIAVISSIPNVDKVSGISEWWGMNLKLRIPGEVEEGSILGVDQNYSVLEKVEILKGRFISANDVENRSMVAVIKPSTAFKVFGRVDCLGEKIEMETYNGTQEFTVIGILDEGESNVLTQMMSTPLLRTLAVVPVTTVLEIFNYEDIIDFYGVSMHDNLKTVETSEDIRNLLNMSHGTTDDYQVESMSTQFEQIDAILNGITGFIAFVAAISLFVGGVGVMNIMLVTVRERTREIGIRKSLGATRGVIRIQFLLEAAILTVLGGIIGLILGAVGAQGIGIILTSLMGTTVTPVVSPFAVSLAIGVSTLVGIVFGVYPAGKAAKLDPVEALRYE